MPYERLTYAENRARRLLKAAEYSDRLDDEMRDLIRLVLATGDEEAVSFLCRALEAEAAEQLVKDDPLFPYPKPEQVEAESVPVGEVPQIGKDFWWGYDDMPRSALLLGSPGGGKTNCAYVIIWNLIGPGSDE